MYISKEALRPFSLLPLDILKITILRANVPLSETFVSRSVYFSFY